MFFRCTNGHEEVRWSASVGDRCWYCRCKGEPHHAIVITSTLPVAERPRWWNRSVA